MVNNYALHNVETMRFWCQKVLPLVYDDSLSYYETLCKVVTKLNEVINNENGQNDAITALDEQVGALAEAQTEQYTELSNAIADEIARAVEAEGGLQEGLTALENYVNTQLDLKEDVANKTTVLANTSTIKQYPTAKTVYDALQGKVDKAQSASDNGKVLSIVGGVVTPVSLPEQVHDVVFCGTSSTFAELIDYLETQNKILVYKDSMGIEMISTSWSNTVGDENIVFSAVVDNVLYTKVLNGIGWQNMTYLNVSSALNRKVDIAQGAGNANKFVVTDNNGNITTESRTYVGYQEII